MHSGSRAALIWTATLLVPGGVVAVVAMAISREAAEILRSIPLDHVPAAGRTELGKWIYACAAAAHCRQALVWAAGQAASAYAPTLRIAFGFLVFWIVCVVLCRPRMPLGGSATGSARYALPSELRRLTVRSGEAWLPLGYLPPPGWLRGLLRFHPTSRVFRALVGPQVYLPAEDLARHMLIVGLTGAHKTTAVTFPVLLEAARHGVSVVALDLKYGEADGLARVASEWQRRARDVLVFAPLEPATLRWNPLGRLRTMGDAHQLAAHLFDEPGPSDPDLVYWMGAERHVCAVLCFALTTDGGAATLGRLRSLCESGPAAVHTFVRAHPAAASLVGRLGAYLAMLPKDQAGILQGIASRLEAWGDEAVCQATGPSAPWEQIDLARVRREPVLLVVGVPQAALGRLRWLCHLFLRDLAAYLLRPRGPEEQVRVLLVLEELSAWGALPGLADHLATYRSRQVSVLATLQSEAQGEHVYGRGGWAAVAANLVTKLYLPSLADADAERLSRVMGTAVGEDVARSRGWGPMGSRTGEHRRAIPVPLERPEELRGIASSPDEILVRFARIPPARLWCPPYHLRPEYSGRVPASHPGTAQLAVYHHLWALRAKGDIRMPNVVESAGKTDPPPAASADAPPRDQGSPGDPSAISHPDATAADEVTSLNRLVEALLLRFAHDAGGAVRGVRRGERLIEVRIHPDAVAEACQGRAAMHALGQRWSVLRWVRRVRPSFVLTRRALNALDPALLQRLGNLCGAEDPPVPTGF